MTIRIRELPPLRQHVVATTPSGRSYRWGMDESDPANVPSGLTSSNTMPGGFEQFDGALPRKPGVDYADLDRLTTLQLLGPGGDVAWEGRLERAPRTSGDQFVINPSAVGWQAHLTDDNSASFVGLGRDLSVWQAPARQRQANLLADATSPTGPTVIPDATTGEPSLQTGFDGAWATGALPVSEGWYDAGEGNLIGRLRATWTRGTNVDNTNTSWTWLAFLSDDDLLSNGDITSDLRAAGPGTVDLAATADRRFAGLHFTNTTAPAGGDGFQWAIDWTNVRVIGDHGLTIQASDGAADEGLLSSDLEAYILGRWAPLLKFTTGSDGTIRPSTFVIPHFVYRDRTNAGEMVKGAVRFELRDWAIWENRTYYSAARGTFGRKWRARVAPAQLQETGPQVDRLFNGVIVAYQDVDGSTRTAGPPGSGCGTEDASLLDSDPLNPANELSIRRWTMLQTSTLTASAAVELGRRFLEEQKLLDTSGEATITGHVEDDRGVVHPYWRPRAGDQISFVDAADSSYRRIVRVEQDHDARTATLTLDSPPDGLAALQERLGASLVRLGVN